MTRSGIYQHFKGGTYRVLCTANDSTKKFLDPVRFEQVVVYVDSNLQVWTRPQQEFDEYVCLGPDCPHVGKRVTNDCLECKVVARFQLIRPE